MILFRDDWNKYPTAFPDYSTSNESFLRLAVILKEMKIKNNNFFLALVNPELKNINPFNPNLTIEEMTLVTLECKINFWYFLREVALAPARSGTVPSKIRANRGNISLYWLFFNHITNMLIQIRQTGKSFSTDVLMTYLLNIRLLNTQINLLTKDEKLRIENVNRIKAIMNELPFYLNQKTKKDADNSETITIKKLGNYYNTHLSQQSIKAAENVGRGLTSAIFHGDETAFSYNIGISLPVALGSMGAAVDIAKANDEPYGIILTTTSGKKDDRDGKFAYKLLSNSALFTEKFYDCANIEELTNVIRKNSPTGELRVNSTFSHRQLGFTDEWLRERIENVMGTEEAIRRDYFNEWTDGNASHPLQLHILASIRESQIDDYYAEISSIGYITRWYIPETEIESYIHNNQCVMAIDPSDAGGGDDISLLVMNIANGKTIAAGTYNETNLILFSEWIFNWLVRFPNLVAIIERRSSGASLIDYLLLKLVAKDMDPFKRLFNRVVNDKDEFRDRFNEINIPMNRRPRDVYVKYKKYFGFATSGAGLTSRSELYSTTLQSASKTIGTKVYDSLLINQIAGLTIKNGRVDHQTGEHDDLVIAWLLAYWLITLGRNLDYYNINSRLVLSELKSVTQIYKDPVDQYNALEQQQIREDIEKYYNLMIDERDDTILRNYESKIKFLSKKLILEENEVFSLDEFMKSIEDERRMKFINKNYNTTRPNQGLFENSYTEDLFNLRDPFYRKYY